MNADMMSDMRTFTVRDLDRQPAKVLAACDSFGEARIRCRDGRVYVLKAEAAKSTSIISLPDFSARRRSLFGKALPKAFVRSLDQALAGE